MSTKKKQKANMEEALPSTSFKSATKSQFRAGTILRIGMKNFMCHSHLEVEFVNNINYITGCNGSGKSAILTALIVGLGGRASLTNRGNSIKDFIKTGANTATVEITLNNNGPQAFNPNRYGDELTIVRSFTASGSSTYKIKAISGEIVSTLAKEVQLICMNLNIQVDNPVCLLNQDVSRNFLNTKDPRQKFILFMRTTGLESLQEKYKQLLENKKAAVTALKEKDKACNNLHQELQELREKVEKHKSIINLKRTITLLQTELLWAKVRDSKNELEELRENESKLEREHAEIQEKINAEDDRNTQLLERIRVLRREMEDVEDSIGQQNGPQNELVRVLSELKGKLYDKMREKRVIEKDIALKTGNCAILEKEVASIADNHAKMESEKQARSKEIEAVADKLRSVTELLKTSENDQFQMHVSITQLQDESSNLKSELRRINAQIESTRSQLRNFKGESSNTFLYGRDVPRVLQAIKAAEHQFTHLPRGPVGSYIKLKDKRWTVAVEGFISAAMLRAFVVHDKRDNALLMDIFEKCWTAPVKPMVITTNFFFQVHDVSPNLVEPVEGCVSIYDALEVSDPVVFNCLIDELGVEGVLLIPDTKRAIELMSDARRVPARCRQGITANGDRFYPDPNYRMYSSRHRIAQYLQPSLADVERQFGERLRNELSERDKIAKRSDLKSAELAEHTERMKEVEVKVLKLNRARAQIQGRHDDLVNAVEPELGNAQSLEREHSELKRQLEQTKTIQQRIGHDVKELQSKIADREAQLEKIKHTCRGYEDRIDPLQQELRECELKLKEFEVNKKFALGKLRKCMSGLEAAVLLSSGKLGEVEDRTADALTLGECPEQTREVRTIAEEINHHQRLIKKMESSVESSEDMTARLESCNERYVRATDLMVAFNDNVKQLREISHKLQQYYKRTQDYFVTFVKYSYENVLKLRQFKGGMDIDMKNGKLDLVAVPQQGTQGHTSTTNLSGGERSFCTVAFLHSLWQCTEFPFYFLDEFDVYMDKINREKVMEILLHHAKSNPDLQFVFLTPQDVSSVNDAEVSIRRLDDPERVATNFQ